LRELADAAVDSADAAVAEDGFDAAVRLNQVAAAAVRRAGISGTEEFDARVAHAKRVRDAYAGEVKAALAVLATRPDDAAANLTVGKFRCFLQGRWDEGVKHLAKGDSLVLKTAAEAEQARDPASDGKAGDAWYEVARVATDAAEKKQADARSRMWYLRALPNLTGLALARAQTRLSVTVGGTTYAPGLIAEFASKSETIFKKQKGRIDPVLTFEGKEFTPTEGGVLPQISVRWTGVVMPPKPGKYRVIVNVQHTRDQVGVAVGKTTVLVTPKKGELKRYDAVVTLPDKPTPLLVTLTTTPWSGHGVKVTWAPVTAIGDGEETDFSEYLFHDKKAESVLK
jgi:hypothetical protein